MSKVAIERAKATGELPHEFLLRVVRGEEIDGTIPTFEQRVDAAAVAAPYFAPKLASIEQKIEADVIGVISADPISPDQWDEMYGADADRVGTPTGTTEGAN